ncbi:MAG: site-specific integrase [Alloalcanivorax sp.]
MKEIIIGELSKKNIKFPLKIEIEEPISYDKQNGPKQIIKIEAWRAKDIAIQEGETPTPSTEGNIHFKYIETVSLEPDLPPSEPWWVCFFKFRVNSFEKENREKFNITHGYPISSDWSFPIRSGGSGRTIVQMARLSKRGWVLFDIDRLITCCYIGCLIVQLGTKTGMRLGEIQQIAASPECLIQVENLSSKNGVVRAVRVKPKGFEETETKYIDDRIFDLLVSFARHQCSVQGESRLPIIAPETTRSDIGNDRYIFQNNGSPVKQGSMAQCLRFILHDVVIDKDSGTPLFITPHMLRHAFATELAQKGVSIDIISRLLSHRRIEPTLYYSEPPAHKVHDAVREISIDHAVVSASSIRTAKELKEQLEEAQEKVGALTEVTGGTCTVGFSCRKKFECIGCAGNVPNPRKIRQIEEKKQLALKHLEWAESEFLLQEARHSKKVIQDCESMLKEMRLIQSSSYWDDKKEDSNE